MITPRAELLKVCCGYSRIHSLIRTGVALFFLIAGNTCLTTQAQSSTAAEAVLKLKLPSLVPQESTPKEEEPQASPKWQYGGFVDLAYPLDFNHPENRLFRSRGTAFRTDSVWLNMAALYVRKRPSAESRWGVELTAQDHQPFPP